MVYRYSMLRFVPDPARGEGVNLGLIVGDEELDDWELRLISNFRRAKALDVAGVLPAALEFAGRLEGSIASLDLMPVTDGQRMTLELLNRLSSEMQNIVQLTPPTPVVADSAAEALDLLFEQLLVDPTSRKFRFEKKHRAIRATKDAYHRFNVPKESIEERARVMSGLFQDSFDFAVFEKAVVQLVKCWSFQLPNQDELAEEVKAWAWVVHELRQHGGHMRTEHGEVEVPADLAVAAVYIPPRPGVISQTFEEAQAAFEEISVEHVPPEGADRLGEEAAKLLGIAA